MCSFFIELNICYKKKKIDSNKLPGIYSLLSSVNIANHLSFTLLIYNITKMPQQNYFPGNHCRSFITVHNVCAIGIMFDKKTHISKCFETDGLIFFSRLI